MVAVSVTVTVTRLDEDGGQAGVDGAVAAALAGSVEQFSSMLTWAAGQAAGQDHGQREKTLLESGRELQRRLLEATLAIDYAGEERISQVDLRGEHRTDTGAALFARPGLHPQLLQFALAADGELDSL